MKQGQIGRPRMRGGWRAGPYAMLMVLALAAVPFAPKAAIALPLLAAFDEQPAVEPAQAPAADDPAPPAADAPNTDPAPTATPTPTPIQPVAPSPTAAPAPVTEAADTEQPAEMVDDSLIAPAIAEMEAAPPAAGVPDRPKPARTCVNAERKPMRRFAKVQRVKGTVRASRMPSTTAVELRVDDSVCPGDLIESGAASEAVLIAEDRTLVAIRAEARLEVTDYRAERKPTDRMSLKLVKGGMRVVSGWLAKLNRADYKVLTPTATIGIRGTDHEVLVLEAASTAQPPDPPGTYNKVNRGGTLISTAAGELPLDAGQAGFADAAGAAAPTLLASIPALFLPSEFDPEIDLFSDGAAAALASALFAFNSVVEVFEDEAPAKPAEPACPDAEAAAKAWLAAFDAAVDARDRPALRALLADPARLLSKARGELGTEIESVLTPEQFVSMSVDWPTQVDGYQHRREALITRVLPPLEGETCGRLAVQSQVIELGRLGGDPMRLESREDYVLIQRDGRWLATEAAETQR